MAGVAQPRWKVKFRNGHGWQYVTAGDTPEVPDLFPAPKENDPREFGRRYMAAAAASHAILLRGAEAVEIEVSHPKTENEPEK